MLQYNLLHYADAEEVYLKAISVEENDPTAKSWHGGTLQGYAVLLEGMNRLNDAQAVLLRLISLAQNDAAKNDAQLKALKEKSAAKENPPAQ